ncbi:uncharacterized protein LOC144148446 [Haemaphysalis longicornis]
MKFLAVWVLIFSLVMAGRAGKLAPLTDDPECPWVNCPLGSNVACFVSPERCQCSCVMEADPCAPLLNITCPIYQQLNCSIEAITCTCRCAKFARKYNGSSSVVAHH